MPPFCLLSSGILLLSISRPSQHERRNIHLHSANVAAHLGVNVDINGLITTGVRGNSVVTTQSSASAEATHSTTTKRLTKIPDSASVAAETQLPAARDRGTDIQGPIPWGKVPRNLQKGFLMDGR